MAKGNHTHRKRGIKASRAKLTRALFDAGLKTQTALAERVADLENLDAAPKDLINRVFRELPVELQTLERVARALEVEAYTLYKTADEEEAPESGASQSAEVIAATRPRWLPAVVAAGVAVLATGGWWLAARQPAEQTSSDVGVTRAFPTLGLGTPTLLVLPLAGDQGGALSEALRDELGKAFKVAAGTASVLTQSLEPRAAAERLRTDIVVDGDIVTVGRLSGVRLYLYARGVRQQVWAESLPAAALEDQRPRIAHNASLAIRRMTGLPMPESALPAHFPLAPVQDDYLQGELHLDQPSNELNIKRAQSRFQAALRQDANFARAHAGLCQSLLEEHWMGDEERALKDAARACGQALQLAPDDPVVSAAHAHFLRRTGRNHEAISLYEKVIESNPQDSAALAGLASSRLQEFRQSGDHEMLVLAKAEASAAAAVDPFVWKPLFALATMEWFDGNVRGAIAASEAALARDENEYVLANLGSFYLCDGAYEKARDAYLRARELAPYSYVGDEFLGMVYYFLRDFGQSAELRRRAIGNVGTGAPEIHEMWGNLGDSYRQIGETQAAIDAYVRAAEIVERDFLRGIAPAADRVARAYYYTMLQSLDSSMVPDTVARDLEADLDGLASELTSAAAHRQMAQTWLQRGKREKARLSLERAMATCSGYGGLPDLADLAVQRDK